MAAELTKLINANYVSGLVSFADANKDNPRLKGFAPRILNHLLDHMELSAAETVWKISGIDPISVTTVDIGVLAIRFLIYTKRLPDAIELYQRLKMSGQTRKKHIMLIVKELLTADNFHEATTAYLEHMSGSYATDASDIELFLGVPPKFRSPIIKYHLHMPNILEATATLPYDAIVFAPPTAPDGYVLELIPLSSSELAELVNFINTVAKKKGKMDSISKFRESYKSNVKPVYVIDAANIMYYGEGIITVNSYKRLHLVLDNLTPKGLVQVIVHERHCKPPKHFSPTDKHYVNELVRFMEHCSNISLYRTPYGMNDDWFSIVSAIEHSAKLLTNDKFRDHIYASSVGTDREHNLLSVWCREHNVCYTITKFNTVLNTEEPCVYSNRVQKSDTAYYIPRTDGGWIQVPV